MRCGRCGNENSETNRFCGMCGAPLVAKTPVPGPAIPAAVKHGEKNAGAALAGPSAESRVSARSVVEAAPAAPQASNSPIIAGPSFLGLNKPADGSSGYQAGAYSDRRNVSDPLGRTSDNLDYLLEDEEEPKRGWGKLAVVVIALALAGGFGYLRWKQGGFDWLKANEKKAATQTADTPQGETDSGAAPNTAPNPSGSAPNAAPGAAMPPAADGSVPAATETPSAQANPQTTAPQNPTPQTASPQASQAQAPDADPNSSAPPAGSASPPADSDSSLPPPAEAPAPKARASKPSATKPVDTATEAERYIYGRGVRQDCDRGLRMLKPAAEQSNPKAMIALGALYSTGTCTPRDLPTSYRWFALALHKQPDNQPLQDDLQKLWSQMTQPERQLAIKLSQ